MSGDGILVLFEDDLDASRDLSLIETDGGKVVVHFLSLSLNTTLRMFARSWIR